MKKGSFDHSVKLHVGRLIDISVLKMSDNGRTCTVTVDCTTFVTSAVCPSFRHVFYLAYFLVPAI